MMRDQELQGACSARRIGRFDSRARRNASAVHSDHSTGMAGYGAIGGGELSGFMPNTTSGSFGARYVVRMGTPMSSAYDPSGLRMTTASFWTHASSHSLQPTQSFGRTLRATWKNSPGLSGFTISRQSKGQTSTHHSQPVQFSSRTTAMGRFFASIFFSMIPASFWMQSTGQYEAQAPQSMQTLGSMM